MASAARKGNARERFVALSFLPAGDEPPREFRIFAAGLNTTTKGDFLFDAKAAADVMAAFEKHGADLMIDLEHLSLADESVNFDPDARGWCRLEVRNGELWAVDISWTPDGEARLREKRQRYVSPVFGFQGDARRISQVLNIAITALPAIDKLEPLVAATARLTQIEGESAMTAEQYAAVAEALGLGADANIEDVLATIAAMVKKVKDAANGDGDPEDVAEAPEGTPAAVAAAAPPVVAAKRMLAAARVLARLSGKKDIGAAIHEVEVWRKSHVELEQAQARLAQERAALEGGERRRLVGDLVKLGAEIPATAWADDDGTKPAEPWASMAIEQLRTRVVKLSKAKGASTTAGALKPAPIADGKGGQTVTVNGETVQLSAHEIAACKDANAKLEDYAANKLIRARAIAQTA